MKKKVRITEVDEGSNIIDEIMKATPLKSRIKIDIQCYFLHKNGGSFFIPLDEKGNENEEVMTKNREIIKECQPFIDDILKTVDEWIEDGMPK